MFGVPAKAHGQTSADCYVIRLDNGAPVRPEILYETSPIMTFSNMVIFESAVDRNVVDAR